MSPAPSCTGHAHQILVHNPFSFVGGGSGDSDQSSEADHAPPPPRTTTTSLLSTASKPSSTSSRMPRHAFFHVQIALHQITNIPLVSGEFCVQWKFKNVHALPKLSLKSRAKSKSESGTGKEASGIWGFVGLRRNEEPVDHSAAESLRPPWQKHSSSSSASSSSSSHSSASSTSGNSSSSSSRSNSAPSHSLSAFTSSSVASTSDSAQSNMSPSAIPSTSGASESSNTALTAHIPTPARGQTRFLRLKDHNVVWEHTLSLIVRMDIDSTGTLLPSPLKLVILRRDCVPASSGPSNAKPHGKDSHASPPPSHGQSETQTRFGVVNLDLAQYACKGEIQRRYLLRESKTNATLKLTTNLTYLSTPPTSLPPISSSSTPGAVTPVASMFGGLPPTPTSPVAPTPPQVPFTAPPLPPGEILAGISTLSSLWLSGEHDQYRTRPKGLDLYGPYFDKEEMEMDLLGRRRNHRRMTSAGRAASPGKVRKEGDHEDGDEEGPSFDPSRLPLAYGAKTTEMLIDALFNPVPTAERRKESPFTVYVTPMAQASSSSSSASSGERVVFPVKPIIITSMVNGSGGSGDIEPAVQECMKRTETTVSARSLKSAPGGKLAGLMKGPRSGKEREKGGGGAQAGIGAGLGIMGLGMGMGVGMGVGVGVVGALGEQEKKDGEGEGELEKDKDKGKGKDKETDKEGEGEVGEVVRMNQGAEEGSEEGATAVSVGGGGLKGWWMRLHAAHVEKEREKEVVLPPMIGVTPVSGGMAVEVKG